MAVVIHEVVTEVVLGGEGTDKSAATVALPGAPDEAWTDLIVRRAAERVLETLRREWER